MTTFVSATIRTEAGPSLAPRGLDLDLDFVFAHHREIHRRKLCHRLAQALRGGIPGFLVAGFEKIHEILDLRHPFGGQVLELLDECLGVACIHGVAFLFGCAPLSVYFEAGFVQSANPKIDYAARELGVAEPANSSAAMTAGILLMGALPCL